MRAFLMYIDDWLSSKSIKLMDAHEERGYLRLLLHEATEPDCGLPDDDAQLAVLSELGAQWFQPTLDPLKRIGDKTSGQKLRERFELINGRLYNARLLKEFIHQQEVNAKRAEAGKRGGKAKANAKQLLSKCQANATVLLEQTPSKPLANGVANVKQKAANDVCVYVSEKKHTSPDETTDASETEKESADNGEFAIRGTLLNVAQLLTDFMGVPPDDMMLLRVHTALHGADEYALRDYLLRLKPENFQQKGWPYLAAAIDGNFGSLARKHVITA